MGCGGTLAFLKTENLTGHPHLTNDIHKLWQWGMCLKEWPAIQTGQFLSPGISLHFPKGLGCGATLVFIKTENLTGHPHHTNDIHRMWEWGMAFKSDQPYKLVSSYLQVSHYTSQKAWDVVQLWFSLKQKTWLVTPITQMIFIGCDSGEWAIQSDQPYLLVRSYLQVSHYTSQMAWDVVELWLSLKQKTWLVTLISQMIFIGCESGEWPLRVTSHTNWSVLISRYLTTLPKWLGMWWNSGFP